MLTSLLLAGLLLGGTAGVDGEQGLGAAETSAADSRTEGAREQERPRLLLPLYVSNVALGLADVATSLAAYQRGAREVNPMVAPLKGDTWKMTTVRMAGAGATILCVEALRRHGHPRAAVVTMLAINAANAAIVMHNLSVNRAP